jgi:hypothetical protein
MIQSKEDQFSYFLVASLTKLLSMSYQLGLLLCVAVIAKSPVYYTNMAMQPGQRAPNYINPETHGAQVVIIGTVFTSLAAIAVVLRFWAHVRARISAPDDIVIALAWLSSLANTVLTNISSLEYGWNRHFVDIPLEWIKVCCWSQI